MKNQSTNEHPSRTVYTCSGVANTGLLADRIGRGWMKNGAARERMLNQIVAVGYA